MRATWSPLGKGTCGGGSGPRVYSRRVPRTVIERVQGPRPEDWAGGRLGAARPRGGVSLSEPLRRRLAARKTGAPLPIFLWAWGRTRLLKSWTISRPGIFLLVL